MGLLVACALIAMLAWQNRQLRVQQQWLQTRISAPYDGMYVPRIEATDGDGRRHLLGAPHGPAQVLFFFTTTCPYCQRSAPTVLRAARELQANLPGRPQLLGVCHCDTAQAARYAHVHGFDFPVVTLTDRRALMLFRARNVPLLMAIDAEGRVRHSHLGVFDTTERVQDLVAALRRTDAPAAFATVKE
ncbi:TlpA disulfide reductase family protein [Xanthomonas citri pv. glycines]|nr:MULTISPECIES: TlpA disulfide reductase family protein [Xanthomonas]EWC49527.1 cytochrome C biogenesis protein [Xanthomonas citri pv. glycines str. 8ra]QTK37093.1 TlpA family protein disulfide reductase [Xanthomonas citri pv. glycines CFBP 2526]QTK41607.1 TlpA family protein disulfide reductase [Xanthomonas citri pv. glycines]UIX78310.1 TlpA family protein disulfide reductase [Xanthomonas citri pv. glycines]WLA22352.1 TlpA family protein disulfide reductase [Xanthomonas citri pv. glycines]